MQDGFTDGFHKAVAPPLSEQPTVLALARGSQQWVRDLNRWANGSVLDMNLRVTLSIEELIEEVKATRDPALVILDAENSEAIAALRAHTAGEMRLLGIATLPITYEPQGLDALIDFPFSPEAISTQLGRLPATLTKSSPPGPASASASVRQDFRGGGARGTLSVVLGVRGSGSSTIAMATAQSLAATSSTVLLDLGAESALAMYHDLDPSSPTVGDLARAATRGPLTGKQVSACAQPTVSRGYALLAGVRRQQESLLLQADAVAEIMRALQAEFDHVLIDFDAAFATTGGESGTSAPHYFTALKNADRVLLVADSTLHGVHGGLRIFGRLLEAGIPSGRIGIVLNRAARTGFGIRQGALKEMTDFAAEAVKERHPTQDAPKIFAVAEQRGVETAHDEVRPLPGAIGADAASFIAEVRAVRQEPDPGQNRARRLDRRRRRPIW